MHKRVTSAEPVPAIPSLDTDFEHALVELLESSHRAQLIAAGRRLVHVLAPGSRLGLTEGAAEENNDRHLVLPLGEMPRHALKVELPAGFNRAEFERRIALVARLLGAKDDQLRSLRHLRESVHRLERAERLQRALYTIADQASSDRDMPDVLAAMHRIIGSLMYAENFYIVLYDPQSETLRFPYFVDVADPDPPPIDRDFPLSEIVYSPTWYLLHNGVPLMGGFDAIRKQVDGPLTRTGPSAVDWLGVPLLHEGRAVGAIVVQSYREDARYTAQDRTLLSYVAQHVRTALERRRAHEELGRRVAERTEELTEANRVLQRQVLERQRGERLQAALFRIAELASTTDSLDAFYAAVHQVVGGLLYARNFFIALLDDDGQSLRFPYSADEFDTTRSTRSRGKGLTEYVLDHGTALLADSDEMERLQATHRVVQSGTSSICWLGVPLICNERTVGVLAVQSYSAEHRYSKADQELLTFVSYHIANALERKRSAESLKQAYGELEQRVDERTRSLAEVNRDLRQQIIKRERIEQRLKYETLHDSLTGLPNRSLLLRRLGNALERYRQDPTQIFAVLFLDLDRFKVINDSVGHLVGDDLLFQAGGRIRACLKAPDVVARLGGDEFAVLLEHISDGPAACRVAARVITELNRPFRLGVKELFTSTSIGIALAAPHYRRAEELLRDADTAMYRAKAEGRQRYALFDERLRHQAMTLLELENDLRRALTRNEFEPWFQPIVRIDDGTRVGYESLLRWRHPERGLLGPDEFLAVAEENGSAEHIDWQMFALVLEQAPRLLKDDNFISINLSGRHFRSHRLERRLLDLLAQHSVDPKSIRIEVTERALLDNPAHVKRTLERLRARGIAASLDDFGTGYSSLSYLHQYPLQSLKIDRSFVAALDDENTGSTPVVRAIQLLADSLGMQVIAEGIETERQRDALAAMHCPLGQGFLFGRPAPASDWL
ncbi:MAG TPA: EAL domain-containing protein [Rhodanobacteraceae bacterium]|nr:EAL domain-containing protein [Rhodanobacteraceae bacterium]